MTYLNELRAGALDDTHRWTYPPSEEQIQSLMLFRWTHDVQKQQPEALALFDIASPPFCTDYWSDRAWPPADVSLVSDDYIGWAVAKRRLERGGEIQPGELEL